MATRSIIKIEGLKFAQVYKHWDGSPDSTLPWLEAFNKKFSESRGDDAGYKFAQLLRSSAFECNIYNLDASENTGWGVVAPDNDCGADFIYTLHICGKVTYWKV